MASVFVSSPAEYVVVDSRTRSGTVLLPSANAIPYRVLNFKDQYGSFPFSTLTLSTQGGELFDDGTNRKVLTDRFGFMNLYAQSTNRWAIVGGTQTISQTVSSLNVSTLTFGTGTGWVQFGPVQASIVSSIQLNANDTYTNNLFVGNVSTLNDIMFNGLFGNYNNTVLAEVSTGGGTQEFLVFRGSSASDRIRFQTTGNFMVETGVSARLFNNSTIPTLSNAAAALFINTSSNVGIQCNAPTSALDVNGSFQTRGYNSFNNPISFYRRAGTSGVGAVQGYTVAWNNDIMITSTIQTYLYDGNTNFISVLHRTNLDTGYQVFYRRIGIECNAPAFTLDVNGPAQVSSLQLGTTVSARQMFIQGTPFQTGGTNCIGVLAQNYDAVGNFDTDWLKARGIRLGNFGISSFLKFERWGSNGFVLASQTSNNTTAADYILASNGSMEIKNATNVSTFQVQTSSVTFGTAAGWLSMTAAQAIVFSSIQTNTMLGYVSSLLVGTPSTNAFQIPGFNLQLVQNSAAKPVNNLWTIGSDLRIKENVTDANLDRCYDDIRTVKLRRFMWKQDYFNDVMATDRHVLGFLAQEVSTIVPKAVEVKSAYGYPDFQFLNIDQLNMSLYGAVKRTIQDKEILESTVKGQKITIETLLETQTFILSTLNGLQGR